MTVKEAFLIPIVEELLDELFGASFFFPSMIFAHVITKSFYNWKIIIRLYLGLIKGIFSDWWSPLGYKIALIPFKLW